MRFNFLIAVVLIVFNVGCATLFTGSYDNVIIRSTPAGARVTVNGSFKGNTPLTLALRRDSNYKISVHKDGYSDANLRISRDFNAVALVNFINPLGWIIDFATGGLWNFDETNFDVQLETSDAKTN